ncbi:MAG: F0F1 ATP synthase subunit B [Anaerolineales bacterium]|nr:F0F1 ATP synthase subunit B [Anaerolineales bacterium]
MEKLGLNLGYLLVQILNFLIIFVVLRVWVYKPVLGLLEKRKAAIAQGLEDARVAAEARANAEEEAKKILADAQAKANETVRESTERADKIREEIKNEAEAEAIKIRESALQDAHHERDRILTDIRGQIAALSMAATQKLIGAALDEKRQRALIDEFFSGVKSGKVTLIDNVDLSGEAAEVTSALPLSPEEQALVKKDLLSEIGEHASVDFRVDPNILGGLVIRVGDKVLDGSVAGQLEELKQNLG